MTETQFKMIYASGQQFGKAMAQAKELAERARGFTTIEITVVPHPDLDAKDKRIYALESELGDCRLALRDNNAAWSGRELNFEIAKTERNSAEIRAKALEAENAKLRAVAVAAQGLLDAVETERQLRDLGPYPLATALHNAIERLEAVE